jgi:hypothetical protein
MPSKKPTKKTSVKSGATRNKKAATKEEAERLKSKNEEGKAHGLSVEDRAWKLAQLAAAFLSNVPDFRPGPKAFAGNSVLSRDFSSYIDSALERAAGLLSRAEGKLSEVYAFQLFQPGTIHTESEILKAFESARWRGLSSKQPVMDLMKEIHLRFKSDLDAKSSRKKSALGHGVADFQEEIEGAISRAFQSHFGCSFDQFDESTVRFFEQLLTSLRENFKAHFGKLTIPPTRFFVTEEMLNRAFPPAQPGKRAERLYRPHEIFFTCAQKALFDEKLIRPSSEVSIANLALPFVGSRGPITHASIFFRDRNPLGPAILT